MAINESTMKSLPFRSDMVNGEPDRAIDEKIFRQLFKQYFTTGVFPNPSTSFQVVSSTGMNVIVKKGACNIEGALSYETAEQRSLIIQASDTQYDRIDTVVLRLDDNSNARNIDLYVVKGVATSNPTRPILTRNATVYEIGIADIFIPRGETNISQQRITDTRLEVSRCGWVMPIQKIDTDSLYKQIQSDLKNFQNVNHQEFTTWFDRIKGQLSQDQAGNLQNQINTITTDYVTKSSVINTFDEVKAETKKDIPVSALAVKEILNKISFTQYEAGDITQVLKLPNGYIKVMGRVNTQTMINDSATSGGYKKEINLSSVNIDLTKPYVFTTSAEFDKGYPASSIFKKDDTTITVLAKSKLNDLYINWSVEGIQKGVTL